MERGKPVEADFPPIPAAFWQSTNAVTPLPAGCGNDEGVSDTEEPPVFGTMCDRIPLRIVIPTNLAAADDFVVTITLSWQDSAGDAAGAAGTGNDMDLYVYDNRQIKQHDDPESTTFTQQTSSATLAMPESVILGDPRLVDYTLIIVNTSGANTGYHVKAEMKILKADTVFKLSKKAASHRSRSPRRRRTPRKNSWRSCRPGSKISSPSSRASRPTSVTSAKRRSSRPSAPR